MYREFVGLPGQRDLRRSDTAVASVELMFVIVGIVLLVVGLSVLLPIPKIPIALNGAGPALFAAGALLIVLGLI